MSQPDRSYRWIAPIYDWLGAAYTGGGIEVARRVVAAQIEPGQRVLCAGAGTGREAELALARGALVTVLDRSPYMLRRARSRLEGRGYSADAVRFIEADVLSHDGTDYDHVWASFFLNVFSPREVIRIALHLRARLSANGSLWVADFAPSRGSLLGCCLQRAYFYLPLSVFKWVTGNAWHALYDYPSLAAECGLRCGGESPVAIYRSGPHWLWVHRFRISKRRGRG